MILLRCMTRNTHGYGQQRHLKRDEDHQLMEERDPRPSQGARGASVRGRGERETRWKRESQLSPLPPRYAFCPITRNYPFGTINITGAPRPRPGQTNRWMRPSASPLSYDAISTKQRPMQVPTRACTSLTTVMCYLSTAQHPTFLPLTALQRPRSGHEAPSISFTSS